MGTEAGQGAGSKFGSEFTRGSDGKLRDSRGKFVKDSEAAGATAGGKAGDSFGSGFGSKGKKLADSLKSNLKLAAGVFVPLGLAGAVTEIAKIGIAYQDNMNIFKVVSGATAGQMKQVADQARKLGADVKLPGVSAAGAAAAMTELAKAGFTVQQSMDAARGTLQLARVANISEGQAAEIAANAVNAFGIQAKDTSFVVDELAAAANSSSIEITDASDAFKQAAAVFSGLQGPAVGGKEAITELNTAIAILGNNGIKGSDAGTSLKQALLQLTGPAGPAKAVMIELAQAAGGANISLKQQTDILYGNTKAREKAINSIDKMNPGLANMGDIAYDANGKMRPLSQIIDLVTRGTANMTQENRNAAITQIFGSDATRTILALMKGGLPTYEAQRKAILEQGAAAKFAAAKNAGLGGAIDNVKSQFENAAISIFNVTKGPLTAGLNAIANSLPKIFGGVASFASQNAGPIQALGAAVTGAATAFLLLKSAVLIASAAQKAYAAAQAVIAFVQLASQVRSFADAWALLDTAMAANPIGLVVVALGALVAGLIYAYRHSETFRNIVNGALNGIKVAAQAVASFFTGVVWPALVAAFNGIKTAALFLWHNVFEPVWHGIMAVVNVVVGAVRFYINALVAVFHGVAAVLTWLYQNIFAPIFGAIRKVVEIWWLAVQIIFKLFSNIINAVVTAAVERIRAVFSAVFNYVVGVIRFWWSVAQAIFGLFRTYVLGPVVGALTALRNWFASIFNAIAAVVSAWWRAHISPVFAAVRAGWDALAAGFSAIYNNKIKPVFSAFIGFIRNTVVGGFKAGVDAIRSAWAAVQDAARKPVAFVVNHVINPFINGLNKAAAIVGVKDRVSTISGFREGGQFVGHAAGGKIEGAGGISDNRQAVIPGVGAVQLQGGEFVVRREMTAHALPLLRWVNDGMKGGARKVSSYLGRPVADMPGDGSEGWAFKDGGLIGWVKDVWGAISHPLDTIKKPFESALSQIPGVGLIKDFLVGAANKVVGGAISWVTKLAGGGGKVGDAVKFLHAQDGKPYVWASAGPGGYDCSGIVSAVYNLLHGKRPYSHTFSTESASPFFPKDGPGGPLSAAWSHPGEAPAGASVGHMMGRVGNLTFESTGGRGVHLGNTTRQLSDFARIGHYMNGGLLEEKIRLFDSGGLWPSGTLGANLSGHTEYVRPDGAGGGDTFVFNDGAFSGAIMTNSKQAVDLVVGAIKSAKRSRRLP